MELFKSKRFWAAIVGVVVIVLSSFVPDLQPHLDVIVPAILGIIGILIGGYTAEDTANAWRAK